MHTDLHISSVTYTHTRKQNVISLCGCRWWEYRGQSGGIDISVLAVFRVLQLISLDFSETTAHPDLIQSPSSPLPPSNCFCLFINRTCYLQRSRCRAAKYSQQGSSSSVVASILIVRDLAWQEQPPMSQCVSCLFALVQKY